LLVAPQLWPLAWGLLLPIDLLIPAWAERAGRTTFHPEHIAERYGLFMIIVLGESVLAASLAIQGVLGASGLTFELVAVRTRPTRRRPAAPNGRVPKLVTPRAPLVAHARR
jgi:low temperature requirement protein LtrA